MEPRASHMLDKGPTTSYIPSQILEIILTLELGSHFLGSCDTVKEPNANNRIARFNAFINKHVEKIWTLNSSAYSNKAFLLSVSNCKGYQGRVSNYLMGVTQGIGE